METPFVGGYDKNELITSVYTLPLLPSQSSCLTLTTHPFSTKSHFPSTSHPLNTNHPILLMNHGIVRPIPFLNLPPDLRVLFYVNLRSRQPRRQLIPANNNRWIRLEEAIDIFKRAVRSLRIKQVSDRDEGEADACLWAGVLVFFFFFEKKKDRKRVV